MEKKPVVLVEIHNGVAFITADEVDVRVVDYDFETSPTVLLEILQEESVHYDDVEERIKEIKEELQERIDDMDVSFQSA